MLEPTKKHLTKVELRFVGPASRKVEAIKALHALGFLNAINKSEAIPWRECFPEIEGNDPGIYLAGARHREGLTQRKLAELTGIPQRHISEMENGKRTIGKKNAKVFAKVLIVDYRVFL